MSLWIQSIILKRLQYKTYRHTSLLFSCSYVVHVYIKDVMLIPAIIKTTFLMLHFSSSFSKRLEKLFIYFSYFQQLELKI